MMKSLLQQIRTLNSNRRNKGVSNQPWIFLLLSGGISLNSAILATIAPSKAFAGDLEFSSGSYSTTITGPSLTAGPANLLENTTGTTFIPFTPNISVNVSISNPQYTNGLQLGTTTGTTGSPILNRLNFYGGGTDGLFTSNPNGPIGTGVSVANNYAFEFFAFVDPLIGQPKNARYYYGDITVTFNRPVSDPVLHMTGMGGNSSQTNTVTDVFGNVISSTTVTHGHSSEFELITPGITPVRLSGSNLLTVTGNQINNSAATITASCSTGAACGSVKFPGTNITSLTFKVYVRGDAGTAEWAGGDVFLFGATSIAKPVTVSGTVFNDSDGLTDNLIDGTGDNAGGLFANLVDTNGKVVASTAVAANGTYSFLAIGAGQYTVSLSTTAGVQSNPAPASSLPANWTNTGEGTAVAGDGTVDGSTAITVASSNITGVNFGIAQPAAPGKITGTVFEDPNYGGGTGRNLATPTTSPRDGAIVELYKSDGTYVSSTTTSGGGKYTFTGIVAGDYKVRVVNSTVTSSRPGYMAGLLPVQTFRTDATTGTVTDVTDHVGGEKPQEVDAPANTTANLSTLDTATQEVQSLTTVKVGTTAVTGVDFGYNFDTIVNTNNAGQGSLRQFVTNSNSLTNAGLAQVGQTPGQEVSIFMIPDGTAHPGLNTSYATGLNGTGDNANAAVISLSSQLVITDNNTSIDARTQTTNVSNSNTGTMGTGGTVGVDGLTLDLIPKPELVLNFSPMPVVNGNTNPTGGGSNPIVVQGQSTTLAGFAFYGYQIQLGLAGLNKGMIWINPSVTDAGKATITQLFGGVHADGSKAPINPLVGAGIQTSGGAEIFNNYFAYLADATEFDNLNGTNAKFFNNELAFNGPQTTSNSNMSGLYADQLETGPGSKNITVSGNLVRNSNKINATSAQGQGIQISNSTFVTIENNSFIDNNIFGINVSASDSLIRKNIVTGTQNGPGFTQGSGIIVYYGGTPLTGLRNRISQNSIYQNVKLGIDLQIDGVTPNDGLVSVTQPNNGIDYPIVTSSLLSGNDLVVKGYVGSIAAGSPTFANVTLEFFIADDDGNNNGKVFSTDPATVSKPHGEGKTYIGTCTADGNSLFNCTFPNVNSLMPSGQTFDPKKITATATDTVGNTSEFSSVPTVNNPNVLLVKRITAINSSTTTVAGDSLAGYMDSPTNAYDDNTIAIPTQPNPTDPPKDTDKWPTLNSFMLGGINGGNIKPNDEIEYSIYFLSTGDSDATNVLFCDRVPSNVTFLPTAFNGQATAPGGLGTGDRGILFSQGGIDGSLSNIGDGDIGQYLSPGTSISSVYPSLGNSCGTNDNGAIVVNLGTIPKADGAGTPPNSHGFIRFRARVK
jgi:parallel beta-helix repeat protein